MREKRVFKNKQEIVEFVKHQVNIELKNDPEDRCNKNRNILYTEFTCHRHVVVMLSLLAEHKIRHEKHLGDKYWIWVK